MVLHSNNSQENKNNVYSEGCAACEALVLEVRGDTAPITVRVKLINSSLFSGGVCHILKLFHGALSS